MKRVLIWIVFGILFFNGNASAINSSLRFEHLTIEDGLSQNSVFAILQDRYGMLWIGTEVGLNLYDGQRIHVFTRDADDLTSLSDNIVLAICEGNDGTIWVGTDNGLNCFNRRQETFERVTDLDNGLNDVITITSLYADPQNYIWIGTTGQGLLRFDPGTRRIDRHYIHVPGDPTSLSHNDVQTVYPDHLGQVWIGTAGGGVTLLDAQEGTFKALAGNQTEWSMKNMHVRSLVRSVKHANELWIGTWDMGLIRYDLDTQDCLRFMPSYATGSLSHHEIKSLLEDSDGMLWVGTSAGGLNRYNREQQSFICYRHADHLRDSISQDDISALYEDRNHVLWIGTTSAGLDKFVRHKNLFKRYGHDPLSAGSLPNGFVRSLLIDHRQQLWIGTYRGLNIYEPVADVFIPLQNVEREEERGRVLIESLCEDAQSAIWMGTFSGIARFDQDAHAFTWFEHDDSDANSLSHQIVYSVLADREGRIWAGTYHGLNRLAENGRDFIHYLHDPKDSHSLPHDMVITLYQDRDAELWVGTAGGGLSRFDIGSGKFHNYCHSPTDRSSLSHNSVSAICRDSKDRLWVGTADGLNLFDPERQSFLRYGRRNGLPSSAIAAIVPDNSGNLWITHTAGLTCFCPENGAVRNYTTKDGLQGTEFNRGAAAKSRQGELFLGGINGFNRFFPEDLMEVHHRASIHATDILVMGQPWSGEHPVYQTEEVRLGAYEDRLTISFASDDYSSPQQTSYQYILEGVDQAWTYAGYQRTAHYNQLPPGRFVFKVKASLDGANWSSESLRMTVIKIPPFWKTWWFRILVLMFLCAFVYTFYTVRVRTLRRRLDEERQIRKVLEESQNELQRAHQAAALRLVQLRQLMASITSTLVAVDRDGRIGECNTRAAAFFNTDHEAMLNKPLAQMLTGEFAPMAALLDWAYAEPVLVKEKQFVLDRKSEHRIYHLLVYPIMTDESDFQGLLLLWTDITEQTVQETQQYLWEKLKTIGQLQAEITHEIGTPIQEAKFQAYLLDQALAENKDASQTLKQEFKDGLAVIQSNIDRVFAIIKSAKELFYPGRNQKETVNVNKLIETTLMVTRNSLQKRARILIELAEDLPLIQAYPAELSQVLLNLLSNAADAVESLQGKGEITIKTALDGEFIAISVADNGSGITLEVGAQMFAPFFTTKEAGKGTGQGLTLSRAIVENRHKGKIIWQNRPDGGVTFTVQIPLVCG